MMKTEFIYCDFCHVPVAVAVDLNKGKKQFMIVVCQKCGAKITVEIKLHIGIIESKQANNGQ